ncbi:hypothetical protein G4Y79_02835 [Phototrophicus methaneseepsis]|uniref:PhnA-like protein n=1 Tax=Phototrophicus methaneseepsis TaxID=2710758 RepID=A0A7S8EAF1_9CHLR|nr:YrzE family protein [Phototrophicus methaneseepsis]QPC83331.1 hypothetical protein G4Y79_02835 [Phototrophicus methaneseepsis]
MAVTTANDVTAYEVTRSVAEAPVREPRVSWGSILAGVVAAIIVQFMMEMLGVAIGLATINPETEAQAVGPAFGTGVVIWLAATTLISLFVGGWVAARLSGTADLLRGFLHGFVTFGVVALLTFLTLTSGVASFVNGVSNTLSQGLGLVGQTAADIAPEVQRAVDLQTTTEEEIRTQINGLLPEDAEIEPTANLRIAGENLLAAILAGEDTTEVRQQLVTTIANQTELTQAEAEQRVDQWIASAQQTSARAEETIERVSGDIADALAATAGVIFVMLIVGAFAAGAGGLVGCANENAYIRTRSQTEAIATT